MKIALELIEEKMQLLLLRTTSGYMPHDDESIKATQKVLVGDCILVKYTPSRNVKFHRKYWGFVNAVFENIPTSEKKRLNIRSPNALHEAIKFRVGHIETFFSFSGEKFIKTKPTDFGSMDEVQFEVFYNGALDAGVELLDNESVREIIKFL